MKLELSECIEVDTKKLVDEYGQLITESSKQSIIKNNYKFKGLTTVKKSVETQLKNQFESVKMITKKGRYGGTIFELKGFKGLVEYERENKGGRPSLDWTNELLVIRELINQEVALGQLFKDSDDENYKFRGFTPTKILNNLLGFDKWEVIEAVNKELKENSIFSMSGNKNDYQGLMETVMNLMGNQRHIYVAKIEEELSKTNHRISYLDSNRNKIDAEKYEEYMIFKKEVETKIKAENNRLKELKNEYFKAWLNTKDFDIKNEVQLLKEVDNAVQEKFGFKYAYRLFTVFNEIKVEGKGDIDKVRENYFNRIMKNANSSQSKYKQTEEINYSETVFYRLVHTGLYVEVVDSVFCKMIGVESKMVDEVDEDLEELQRHIDNVEQYEAEKRLEQEEEFYNQDIYFDVERMLYELENPLSEEECEEIYKELFEY